MSFEVIQIPTKEVVATGNSRGFVIRSLSGSAIADVLRETYMTVHDRGGSVVGAHVLNASLGLASQSTEAPTLFLVAKVPGAVTTDSVNAIGNESG